MQEAAVEHALEALRPALAADGFDLRIGSMSDDGTVRVVLEAKPDACLDCLVPEEMMITILEDAIRDQDPTLTHVELVKLGFDTVADH
jgi:Fe-S cluster biogenesis protein NfuA